MLGRREIAASIVICPPRGIFSGFVQDRKQISNKAVAENPLFKSSAEKLEQLVLRKVERTRGQPAIRPLGKPNLDLSKLLDPQSLDSTIVDLRSGELPGVRRVSHLSHPHSLVRSVQARVAVRSPGYRMS
jgi:hypothetical protein